MLLTIPQIEVASELKAQVAYYNATTEKWHLKSNFPATIQVALGEADWFDLMIEMNEFLNDLGLSYSTIIPNNGIFKIVGLVRPI